MCVLIRKYTRRNRNGSPTENALEPCIHPPPAHLVDDRRQLRVAIVLIDVKKQSQKTSHAGHPSQRIRFPGCASGPPQIQAPRPKQPAQRDLGGTLHPLRPHPHLLSMEQPGPFPSLSLYPLVVINTLRRHLFWGTTPCPCPP